MIFSWKKRRKERTEVERKLDLQDRLVREAENRLRRLEQETELYRLRRHPR